jgi:hypothetical protein
LKKPFSGWGSRGSTPAQQGPNTTGPAEMDSNRQATTTIQSPIKEPQSLVGQQIYRPQNNNIQKPVAPIEEPTKSFQTFKNELLNKNPTLISIAINIADNIGGILINNINNVLLSNANRQTTLQAAEQTVEIVKEILETFNKALDDPLVKAQIQEGIKNAGELGGVIIQASKEPFKEAIVVAAESAQQAITAALTGAIKVGTDTMASVPYLGAIISLGKAINNASTATASMLAAGSDVAIAARYLISETKNNVNKILNKLEKNKLQKQQQLGGQITKRTNNSIYEFENPGKTTGEGIKTRRKPFNRYTKSKRVRFVI